MTNAELNDKLPVRVLHVMLRPCATLEASGVKVIRAPGPMTSGSPDRSAAEIIAFIEDPDGYKIELVEAYS